MIIKEPKLKQNQNTDFKRLCVKSFIAFFVITLTIFLLFAFNHKPGSENLTTNYEPYTGFIKENWKIIFIACAISWIVAFTYSHIKTDGLPTEYRFLLIAACIFGMMGGIIVSVAINMTASHRELMRLEQQLIELKKLDIEQKRHDAK